MRSISLVFAAMLLFIPVAADRYYVHSDNAVVKALLGPVHQFDGVFSTDLTKGQVRALNRLGVKTEAVGLYYVSERPKCGDTICHPSEKNTCPTDCLDSGEEPTCSPSTQMPWGVVKVNGGTGGANVTVAVLDTGVDVDHKDLKDNIVLCESKVTHFRQDMGSCDDAHGHGTHVAGTILANGGSTGTGIYGVAPDASLIAVKVCDRRGSCYGDDISSGIRYATDNGANIISMSIGGDSPDSQVLAAIDYATNNGVLVVAAAGNDGPSDGSIDYPAGYYKTVAVGATDSSNNVPDWSSRGINDGDWFTEEREVELAAHGVSIYSTYNDGCYATMSGTSMATPHVSGLAAKLWQGSADLTRDYLHTVSEDIWTTGDDTATGWGLPIAP